MTKAISLCLLTWNEIHGCQQVIPNLPQGLFSDVFALDGGSTDGTIEYLTSAGIGGSTSQTQLQRGLHRSD